MLDTGERERGRGREREGEWSRLNKRAKVGYLRPGVRSGSS